MSVQAYPKGIKTLIGHMMTTPQNILPRKGNTINIGQRPMHEKMNNMQKNTYFLHTLWYSFLFIIIITMGCSPKTKQETMKKDATTPPATYNAELAQRLGADDYGMRKYVMAFLKAGSNRDRTPEEAQALQRAHMDNINRLAEEGKLALAGPFLDNGELRGIYIFAVESVEEARELTATDPAIKAGSLIMELHPWYGSAGVMEINALHKQVQKVGI